WWFFNGLQEELFFKQDKKSSTSTLSPMGDVVFKDQSSAARPPGATSIFESANPSEARGCSGEEANEERDLLETNDDDIYASPISTYTSSSTVSSVFTPEHSASR